MPDKIRLPLTISLALAVSIGLYVGVELKQEYERINSEISILTENLSYSKKKVQQLEKKNKELQNKLFSTQKILVMLKNSIKKSNTANFFKVKATAYGTSRKNGGSGKGVTATGVRPKEGVTVAVDPKKIPLGSKIYIECPTFPSVNGVYIAQDVGGAIKKNRIDIYMEDYKRKNMLKFGIREVMIKILEKPKPAHRYS